MLHAKVEFCWKLMSDVFALTTIQIDKAACAPLSKAAVYERSSLSPVRALRLSLSANFTKRFI
jgi:hypothetical protein